MRIKLPLFIYAAVLTLCFSKVAEAQSWKSGTSAGQAFIEIASLKPGAALRLECAEGRKIWLRYYPVRGWNGGLKVAVRIGDYTSPMEIDGGDGALLSNLPGGDIGVTKPLLEAMKQAKTFVVEGPAAVSVPLAQRTFSLTDAMKPLTSLEARCAR